MAGNTAVRHRTTPTTTTTNGKHLPSPGVTLKKTNGHKSNNSGVNGSNGRSGSSSSLPSSSTSMWYSRRIHQGKKQESPLSYHLKRFQQHVRVWLYIYLPILGCLTLILVASYLILNGGHTKGNGNGNHALLHSLSLQQQHSQQGEEHYNDDVGVVHRKLSYNDALAHLKRYQNNLPPDTAMGYQQQKQRLRRSRKSKEDGLYDYDWQHKKEQKKLLNNDNDPTKDKDHLHSHHDENHPHHHIKGEHRIDSNNPNGHAHHLSGQTDHHHHSKNNPARAHAAAHMDIDDNADHHHHHHHPARGATQKQIKDPPKQHTNKVPQTTQTSAKKKTQEKPNPLVQACEATARTQIKSLPEGASSSKEKKSIEIINQLSDCVEDVLRQKLVKTNEEISFQGRIHRDIAVKLENYTCRDENMQTSPDVYSKDWYDDRARSKDVGHHVVHVKLDRPAAQIHVIENFIRPDECEAMDSAASKRLHRATVADGKGGSKYSDNRKAMQAGIRVPWNKEKDDHPIARLSRRVYDYTNHVLGYSIEEHGQEDLMSIQYFGRGREDKHPDQYMPHCDGDCSGVPHKLGTRMATMVVYCTVPREGGGTNFRNAGVHVKATQHSAVFFSYIDPKTNTTDNRLTEHSGCPVYDGEKKIVTQWIRLGVDKENPWDSFNTLGIKISDANKQ